MTAVSERTGSERVAAALAGGRPDSRWRQLGRNVVLYILCFSGALAIASLLVILATDSSPFDVVDAIYQGALATPASIGLTLDQATPILIVALGAVIANRAGIINIGNEGQVLIGGTVGALFMFRLSGTPLFMITGTLLAAIVGGAAWAAIAATLRYWRGIDVVISTLLLNFIAIQVVSFTVNKTWLLQEQIDSDILQPQSPRLAEAYQLPRIGQLPGFTVSSAVFIAIALLGIVTFALARTRWGFRLRMLGLNANAAQAAGVSMIAVGGGALVLSGAFAGLAGGVLLTGSQYRITPAFSSNVGYQGLLVALISRQSVLATVPVALFFGILRAGGGFLAITGVPRYIVDVVQALVVLAALLPPVIDHVQRQRAALRTAQRAARAELQSPSLEVVAG